MKQLFFLVVIALCSVSVVQATDYYWVYGGVNTNWSTLGNWRTVSFSGSVASSLPTSSDNVFVGNGATAATIIVNVSDSINNLTLQGSGAILIGSSNSAVLHVWGNITSSNTSTGGGGVSGNIVMDGPGTQSITGNSTGGQGRLTNITIAKASTDSLKLFNTVSFGASDKLVYTSGIVEAGSSTVYFAGTNTVQGSFALNHVESFGNGTALVVSDSLTVKGNLKFSGTGVWGINTGVVKLHGNLECPNASGSGGGSATLIFTGSANQTYAFIGGRYAKWIVNKSAGTVSAASGTTNLAANFFQLENGTFTAPSGTFTLGNTTITNNVTNQRFTHTGGTFSHNNGTVAFVSQGANNHSTIDCLPTTLFYNVTANAIQYGQSGGNSVKPVTGDSVRLAGTLTHSAGQLQGVWRVEGNLVLGTNAGNGLVSAGEIWMVGSSNTTYTANSSGRTGSLIVVKPGASLSPASGTADFNVYTFKLISGTFNTPTGTLSVGSTVVNGASATLFTHVGGTFEAGSGTVEFVQQGGTYTGTVDVLPGTRFNHVTAHAYPYGNSNNNTIAAAAGDSINLHGNLFHSTGAIGGVWNVEDNLSVGVGALGGSGQIRMTGSSAATYGFSGSGCTANLLICKTGAAVTAASGTTDAAISSLTIASGDFTAPTGTLTLRHGLNNYAFNHVAGTFAHNNGTVKLWTVVNVGSYTVDVLPATRFYHFVVSSYNSGVYNGGTGDSLKVDGNLTLTNAGRMNTMPMLVKGNVTVGGYNGGTAPLIFCGTGNQTFDLTGHTFRFDASVVINKPTGDVTLLSALLFDFNGNQNLYLLKGNLITTSTNLLTLEYTNNYVGGSDSSHVVGPMKKMGQVAFAFPVGNGTHIYPIRISAPALASEAYTAEYIDSAYNESDLDTSLTYASHCGYWNLVRNVGSTNVKVRLNWNPSTCDVYTLSTLRIARYDDGNGEWKSVGAVATSGTAASGYIETTANQATFGKFAIGKKSPSLLAVAGNDTLIDYAGSTVIGNSPAALGGVVPYSFSWSPMVGLSNSTIANPIASPTVTTTYTLVVTDLDRVVATDEIVIYVNPHVSIIRPLGIDTTDLDSVQLDYYRKLTAVDSLYSSVYLVKAENPALVQDSGFVKLDLPFISCPPMSFKAHNVQVQDSLNYEWYGRFYHPGEDSTCSTGSLFMVSHAGALVGHISLHRVSLELFDLTGGVQLLCKRNMELIGICENERTDEETDTDDGEFEDCDVEPVKVLVLYTQKAAIFYPDVPALAALAVSQTENIFLNSAIGVDFELVATLPFYSFVENDEQNIWSDMNLFQSNANVHALVGQYQADIVVLFTQNLYYNSDKGVYVHGMCEPDDIDNLSQYVIAEAYQATTGRYTFAHEVAHSFGAHHGDGTDAGNWFGENHDETGDGWPGHGHKFHACGAQRQTLMWTRGNNDNRLDHISNPNVSYCGDPTGETFKDNAFVLNLTKHIVSHRKNDPAVNIWANILSIVPPCNMFGYATCAVSCGSPPFQYQWYFSLDGYNWISYANTQDIVYIVPFLNILPFNIVFLKVEVTDDDDNTITVVQPSLGMGISNCRQSEADSLQAVNPSEPFFVYPTFVNNQVTVRYVQIDESTITIRLVDLTGRVLEVLFEGPGLPGASEYPLTISGQYPPGMYFINLETGKTKHTGKVLFTQ